MHKNSSTADNLNDTFTGNQSAGWHNHPVAGDRQPVQYVSVVARMIEPSSPYILILLITCYMLQTRSWCSSASGPGDSCLQQSSGEEDRQEVGGKEKGGKRRWSWWVVRWTRVRWSQQSWLWTMVYWLWQTLYKSFEFLIYSIEPSPSKYWVWSDG